MEIEVLRKTMNPTDTLISEASQRELATGVLKQATQDLRRFYNATTPVERELYSDAYSWVMSDDRSWPFSFLNVCQLLNHEPTRLRDELLGDLALGLFAQWALRGIRALHRLSDSLKLRRPATDRTSTVTTSANLLQTSH
jgi:hypothetical protein